MSRVGVDLDGVCYDFAASLRESIRQRQGGRYIELVTPDPERWEFYEDWGYSLDEFIELCNDGVDQGIIFSHGDPFPGTQEALQRIKDAGHTIHIVTDRSFGKSGGSERATRVWLDTHKIPFDSLTFSADKTVVRADWFIDDKLSNYDALRNAGVLCYLLDRPWNQAPVPYRYRVDSLETFARMIPNG